MMLERFIEQDPGTRRYRLGFSLLVSPPCGSVSWSAQYRAAASSGCEMRSAKLSRSSSRMDTVGMPGGRRKQAHARVGYDIGERAPLYASAGGQVLLAYFAEADRHAVYAAGLRRYTPRTLTDVVVLEKRLAHIRAEREGWAEDSYFEGVVGAAAPIFDPKQRVSAVVTLAAPMQRCGVSDLPRLSAAARRTAEAIAEEWSGLSGAASGWRSDRHGRSGVWPPRCSDRRLARHHGTISAHSVRQIAAARRPSGECRD